MKNKNTSKMPQEEPMDVDSSKKPASVQSEKPPPDPDTLTFEDIKDHCKAIERGENTKEPRFINRVLRSLITTRKRLNGVVLSRLVNYYFVNPTVLKQKEELLTYIKSAAKQDEAMDIDKPPATVPKSPRQQRKTPLVPPTLLPEIEAYIHLLVLLFLWDAKRYDDSEKCVNSLMKRLENQNRRSLDPLLAKVFYFYSVICEKKLSSCVEFFHTRLRTATLRHDEDSQATLINCLLRAYLQDKLYELAGKLNLKISYPDSAGNNEWARYHYYVGRINAMELRYPEAKAALQLALRKAPQHTALGFRQTVQKLLVTIELLLGTIPDRSLFRQAIYRKALSPYMQIAQAVRIGDVEKFNKALTNYTETFVKDDTYTLVVRLRQNVIKTAVRQISLAYSRISIKDIQKKLMLSHPDDAEYIVAKAIKDGVIEATINHADGYMQSKTIGDLYATTDPQQQYNSRIVFCLGVYNQAVKAMRFPPKSYNKDIESAEEKREREQQELEFAKEMAEEDDEGF